MGKTITYFKEWFTDTVNYGKKLSMDGVGQITYASDVELDCATHGTILMVRILTWQELTLVIDSSWIVDIDR